MTVKETLVNKIESLGYELGCYSDGIDKLPKKELFKVLNALEEDYIDVPVMIRRRSYMIEVCTVDNEKDLVLLSKDEYEDRYGVIEEE